MEKLKWTKNKLLYFVLLLTFSCKSSKPLIYALPFEVEKRIYKECEKYTYRDKFFILNINFDEIEVYIIPSNDINKEEFSFLKVINSNRLLRINDKLHHLVFLSDEKYGTNYFKNKIQSIKQRELLINNEDSNLQGKNRKTTIYDKALFLKFKNNKLVDSINISPVLRSL